jgi:hypothetical protein
MTCGDKKHQKKLHNPFNSSKANVITNQTNGALKFIALIDIS